NCSRGEPAAGKCNAAGAKKPEAYSLQYVEDFLEPRTTQMLAARSPQRSKVPFSWSDASLVLAFLSYGSVNQRTRSPHPHSLLPPADHHRDGRGGAGIGVAAISCRPGAHAAVRMVRHQGAHPARRWTDTQQDDRHASGGPSTSAGSDRGGDL